MQNSELIPSKDLDSIKQLDSGLRSVTESLLKTAEAVTLMIEEFKKTKDTETATKKMSAAERELARLARERATLEARKTEEIKKAAAENAKLRNEIRLQTREAAANANTIEGLRVRVARLTDTWKNAERGTKEYRKSLRELSSAQKELSKEEAKGGIFGRNVGNYPKPLSGLKGMVGWAAIIGAVGGAVKNATKTIVEFEQANANLATILGKSRSEITDLTESAKQLGATTEWTASQVTELQTELAKLGFNEREIRNMQASILQFSTAMGADLGRAAALAGASLRAFNLDSTETERVAGVMTVGANRSALSFSYLETAMSTIAPVARTFGFGIEDTVALLGTLANSGFDASSAATATRNILLNLADANGKLAQTLGQPVRNLDEMASAFATLRDKGVDLATTLELTDKRSVSAFNTFLQGSESMIKLRGELSNTSGELERIQKERLNTVEGSVKLLTSAWEGLMLSFSNSTGIMRAVVDGLAEVVSWLNRALFPKQARQNLLREDRDSFLPGFMKDLEKQIAGYKRDGYTVEQATNDMIAIWNKDAANTLKENEAWLKQVGFYEEEGKKNTDGWQKAMDGAAQSKARYDALQEAIAKAQKSLNPQTETPTGGVTVVGGKGDKAEENAREKRLQKEREAIRKNLEATYEMRQAANKRIIEDENRTYEQRFSALNQYYILEDRQMSESARLQKENLILKEMETGGVNRESAEKRVANQLLSIDLVYQQKKLALDEKYIKDRQSLDEKLVQNAISNQKQQSAARAMQMELEESDELTALSKRYKNMELRQEQYEKEREKIARKYAEQRAVAELEAAEAQLATLESLLDSANVDDASLKQISALINEIKRLQLELKKLKNEAETTDNENFWDEWSEKLQKIEADIQRWGQIVTDVFSTIADAMQVSTDKQLAELDKQQEAAEEAAEEEKERVEGLAEVGAISEEQKDARIELADQQLAEKQKQIEEERIALKRRQAKYDKAATLSQAILNGALAVTSALATRPFLPLGPIMATIAGALAAAQIGIIAAQPLPEYATGTDFHPGGLAVVGDGGRSELLLVGGYAYKTPATPTLLDLPKGAQVMPDYNTAIRDMILTSTLQNGRPMPKEMPRADTFSDRNLLERLDKQTALMNRQIRNDERARRVSKFREFKNTKVN